MSDDLDTLLTSTAAPVPEEKRCACGRPFRFDPTIEGYTCGGLYLAGWLICDGCGATSVTKRGRPAGPFRLAGSGRSLDADGFRIRAEGRGGDPTRLMARLARVPAMEAALRRVARDSTDKELVAAALAALESG